MSWIMSAPVQIRNSESTRRIRELAELKGTSITEAVDEAVGRELERSRRRSQAEQEARRTRVNATLARIWSRPKPGVLLTDEDLYDADGLPRNSGR
jgi:hypothetical protein